MTDQEMVDRFALVAKPRWAELLRLKGRHVYEDMPGDETSTYLVGNGKPVSLKLKRTMQPYGSIERFTREDKEMGFVVNPGLLPLVKAITLDVRGLKLLITRRIAPRADDKGAVAHVEGAGVRVMLFHAPDNKESYVVWECLYGVV